MEKVLNQEEIDAMVRSARSAPSPAAKPGVPAERWDVRGAGQIGREQLLAINSLHEGFARNLTHALGAYLRVGFAAALVSAEHLGYREFLQSVPETTYLVSCRLNPLEVSAALQLDLKVAFPIIDLLLGGEGKAAPATREITDIEEQILDSVARIICRELGAVWQPLSLEVAFEQRLEAGAARRLMPPEEKTLCLSFEITMQHVRGGLNLAIPATASNALLRRIAADWSRPRVRHANDSRQRLMRRLIDCEFLIELGATDARLQLRNVAALVPGSVVGFARSAAHPASLLVAGRPMFRAIPARVGSVRSARILERTMEDGPDLTGA